MSVIIAGAGAFGTGLAIALAREQPVTLWSHSKDHAAEMQSMRENRRRLPGAAFPDNITITAQLTRAEIMVLAVPMQQLATLLEKHKDCFSGTAMVACCKGIDRKTGLGPVGTIEQNVPDGTAAVLTGPSFASDIAQGLPTALTLACSDDAVGLSLQEKLSARSLRLYRTTDTIGAELGGALKNVMAIACGAAIGAGLGHSARAAVMTRGFAEMTRYAVSCGAQRATLSGLSGFGDLALTCTSEGSRNYRYGVALGSGAGFDEHTTVEGAATALAMQKIAQAGGLDMPITETVAALVEKKMDMQTAIERLLSRPLKEE